MLCYVLQQVAWFRKMGKDLAMQHAGTEHLDEVEGELQAILDGIPDTRLPKSDYGGLRLEELAEELAERRG